MQTTTVSAAAADPREMLAAAGDAIVAGIERSGPRWAVRSVDRILDAWAHVPPDRRAEVRRAAERAGARAAVRVASELRDLLALDPTVQRATPQEIVRSIVAEPTELLHELGVPAVVRDPFDERAQPDDVYDLAPRTLTDLDPSLGPELVVWGIAKAKIVRGQGQTGRPGTE